MISNLVTSSIQLEIIIESLSTGGDAGGGGYQDLFCSPGGGDLRTAAGLQLRAMAVGTSGGGESGSGEEMGGTRAAAVLGRVGGTGGTGRGKTALFPRGKR